VLICQQQSKCQYIIPFGQPWHRLVFIPSMPLLCKAHVGWRCGSCRSEVHQCGTDVPCKGLALRVKLDSARCRVSKLYFREGGTDTSHFSASRAPGRIQTPNIKTGPVYPTTMTSLFPQQTRQLRLSDYFLDVPAACAIPPNDFNHLDGCKCSVRFPFLVGWPVFHDGDWASDCRGDVTESVGLQNIW
jgi:hypothetical protein